MGCVEAVSGEQPWRCSVPCLRLGNVLDGFSDVFRYTLWGTSVIRGKSHPMEFAEQQTAAGHAPAWWESAEASAAKDSSSEQAANDSTTTDLIEGLVRQLGEERNANRM